MIILAFAASCIYLFISARRSCSGTYETVYARLRRVVSARTVRARTRWWQLERLVVRNIVVREDMALVKHNPIDLACRTEAVEVAKKYRRFPSSRHARGSRALLGVTTSVVPLNSYEAGRMNERLLPELVGIMASIGDTPSYTALRTSSCFGRNSACGENNSRSRTRGSDCRKSSQRRTTCCSSHTLAGSATPETPYETYPEKSEVIRLLPGHLFRTQAVLRTTSVRPEHRVILSAYSNSNMSIARDVDSTTTGILLRNLPKPRTE
ncbi:hypothetical protein KCU67_g33, partial [Aureobasidium melanogenum]